MTTFRFKSTQAYRLLTKKTDEEMIDDSTFSNKAHLETVMLYM